MPDLPSDVKEEDVPLTYAFTGRGCHPFRSEQDAAARKPYAADIGLGATAEGASVSSDRRAQRGSRFVG